MEAKKIDHILCDAENIAESLINVLEEFNIFLYKDPKHSQKSNLVGYIISDKKLTPVEVNKFSNKVNQ